MRAVTHRVYREVVVAASAFALVLSTLVATPTALAADVSRSLDASTVRREPDVTPAALADGLLDGLQYADPTAGLVQVDEPVANSYGSAQVSYPLVLPEGRGLTPDIQLRYDSAGRSSWVGYGWDLKVGEVTVDTTFGVPLFCPRQQAPACADVESETYRLDGELLAPTAARTDRQPRIAERSDFTRKVETQYEHIIRHGDSPRDYSWEVRDKSGGVRWYGGFPDEGGPFGRPGSVHEGATQNDRKPARSAIAFDDKGNAFTWYLKAQRDVGVNTIRYEYETTRYYSFDTGNAVEWRVLTPGASCPADTVCGRHVYLSKIFYTGAAEVSHQPENPAYVIELLRGARRADPVVSARGGYVDVDLELLTQVKVSFIKPGGAPQLAMRYDLDNHGQPGAFGKTLLRGVHQVGCSTTAATSRPAPHTPSATSTSCKDKNNFDSTDLPLRRDGIAGLEGRASSLGMSESVGGDGHALHGFQPLEAVQVAVRSVARSPSTDPTPTPRSSSWTSTATTCRTRCSGATRCATG